MPPDSAAATRGSARLIMLVSGVVVVVLLAIGSLIAIGQQSSSPASVRPAAAGGGQGGSVNPVVPSMTSTPAVPGTALVSVDPAASRHPRASELVALLDDHFRAINTLDFASWAATVTTDRAADQSRQGWLDAFGSTNDEAVVIHSISGSSTDVVVELSFTSNQDPSDAPSDLPVSRICWQSRWPVFNAASDGRIGVPTRGATTRQAC